LVLKSYPCDEQKTAQIVRKGMGTTIQGVGGSKLTVKDDGLEIWLPKRVFGKGWLVLKERLLAAIGKRQVIIFNQGVMTERRAEEDAPRWKENVQDVLSWVLYQLKVASNHELVGLWAVIDWQAINRIGGEAYKNAYGGRPAWAPAQLVAILILMFLYGIGYETRIIAQVKENIVWCWFCGFSLFGPFPAHDALYDFRKRIGVERFEQVLTIVVQACLEAGLIANDLVYFDLTPVVASAHRWSPYERAVVLSRALHRYLEQVWAKQRAEEPFPEALRELAVEVALEVLPHKSLEKVKPERVGESIAQWEQGREESTSRWQESSEEIVQAVLAEVEQRPLSDEEEGAGLRTRLLQVAKKILVQLPHTRGDQDARVGRTTNYTWFCGYLLGFVVDGAYQVITAVVWAAGNVKQATLLKPALQAHQERLTKPNGVATDSAFDDPAVYNYLDQQEIVGHITSRAHTPPSAGGYGTERVTWEEGPAQPLCPNQEPLTPKGRPQQGRQTYEGTTCGGCPIYQRCYPSGAGEAKQFSLNPTEHRRWQENRAHCQTEAYKAARQERFVSEGRFGLAKSNHRAGKVPYRSDEMNHIAGLVIAIVLNCRLLARHQ
jgi:transposase